MARIRSVGRRIRSERRLRGWSQRALARKAGVSQQAVCSIETGFRPNPRWNVVMRLHRALGLSLDMTAGLL